jgi:hypothetical protein
LRLIVGCILVLVLLCVVSALRAIRDCHDKLFLCRLKWPETDTP